MAVDPALAGAGLALASAASWGAGDFVGGTATRQISVFRVIVVAETLGLLGMIVLALVTGEAFPPGSKLVWGALAGTAGTVGQIALYRAMAAGRMGIAAPVSAVLSTALPVAIGILTEGLPGPLRLAGFALALAAIWLISRPEAGGGRPEGLGLALLAGVGFAAYFILLDRAGEGTVFWVLAAGRVVSLPMMVGMALAMREGIWPGRAMLPWIVLLSLLNMGGNIFYFLAAQVGRLDVAVVLTSLYPAVTVILAWLILKERMTRLQTIGVIAALVAVPLITV